jgi:plastocyanin
MFNKIFKLITTSTLLLALGQPALAGASETYELSIRNHRFEPAQLTVPAGVKVKLVVKNLDNGPEEFESYLLHREKLIPAGSQVTIFIGPLKAGTYDFFGEFHSDTAKGQIIAK